MEPMDIRVELLRRRITMSSIARDMGCSLQAVKMVIERRSVSNRLMVAVAEAIGQEKEQVFPEYFLKKAV